ncbi:MAG: hypothetical protein HC858_02320 [Brachymonas sp.]|nr:hypothetical protein [Brachymonas sp.]
MPAKLGNLERSRIESRSQSMMGIHVTEVSAGYGEGNEAIEIDIQDIGASAMLAAAMGSWAQGTVDKDTKEEAERVYRKDGIAFKEFYRKDGRPAPASICCCPTV